MRLICVPLTDDRRHEEAIKDFVIDREAGIPKNLDYVASVSHYKGRVFTPQARANARLIANAPNMYQIVTRCRKCLESIDSDDAKQSRRI